MTNAYLVVYLGGGRKNSRLDREHRIIARKVLGRDIPKGVEIHHVDGNGMNNAHTNLVICENRAYHQLLHRRQRIKTAGGNPNTDYWCSRCQRPRLMELFYKRSTGVPSECIDCVRIAGRLRPPRCYRRKSKENA